jgi:hypothetical protein
MITRNARQVRESTLGLTVFGKGQNPVGNWTFQRAGAYWNIVTLKAEFPVIQTVSDLKSNYNVLALFNVYSKNTQNLSS